MENVRQKMIKRYEPWNINFPEETFTNKQYTHIRKNGWSIFYQFGKDVRGEYVELYSQHRMTSDSHCKIYKDGDVEYLDSFRSYCIVGKEEEYKNYNKKVNDDVYGKNGIMRCRLSNFTGHVVEINE